MMGKGYITEEGRVVQVTHRPADPGLARSGHRVATYGGDFIVGELLLDEQRYNLRRTYVARTWYAVPFPRPADDHRLARERALGAGGTRREAIEGFLSARKAQP